MLRACDGYDVSYAVYYESFYFKTFYFGCNVLVNGQPVSYLNKPVGFLTWFI